MPRVEAVWYMYLSLYPFLQCTVEDGSCNYNIRGDDTLSFSREEIANFTLNITVDECKFMHGGFTEILASFSAEFDECTFAHHLILVYISPWCTA